MVIDHLIKLPPYYGTNYLITYEAVTNLINLSAKFSSAKKQLKVGYSAIYVYIIIINPFNPEFIIVIFIHYKPRIANAILDL